VHTASGEYGECVVPGDAPVAVDEQVERVARQPIIALEREAADRRGTLALAAIDLCAQLARLGGRIRRAEYVIDPLEPGAADDMLGLDPVIARAQRVEQPTLPCILRGEPGVSAFTGDDPVAAAAPGGISDTETRPGADDKAHAFGCRGARLQDHEVAHMQFTDA